MSARDLGAFARLSTPGELEAEISLLCRVEYRVDARGEVDIVSIVPLGKALSPETRVNFRGLPPHEQRCLLAGAGVDARERTERVRADEARSEEEACAE